MESKEINTILRYKRPCDSWLCPDCDTENNISLGKCTVCGCSKSLSPTILKQWAEADDKQGMPSKKTYTSSDTIFKDMDKDDYIPEEENKNKIILGIIIAIIVLALFVAAIQGSTYDEYSDNINEHNYGECETTMVMFEEVSYCNKYKL